MFVHACRVPVLLVQIAFPGQLRKLLWAGMDVARAVPACFLTGKRGRTGFSVQPVFLPLLSVHKRMHVSLPAMSICPLPGGGLGPV